jgi:hypothetical protein
LRVVQNFGLRDGVPGTAYNKAVNAVEDMEDILIPLLREALADEALMVQQGTILGRVVEALRDEGANIMNADLDEKVAYFCMQVTGLVLAGMIKTPFASLLHCDGLIEQHVVHRSILHHSQTSVSVKPCHDATGITSVKQY